MELIRTGCPPSNRRIYKAVRRTALRFSFQNFSSEPTSSEGTLSCKHARTQTSHSHTYTFSFTATRDTRRHFPPSKRTQSSYDGDHSVSQSRRANNGPCRVQRDTQRCVLDVRVTRVHCPSFRRAHRTPSRPPHPSTADAPYFTAPHRHTDTGHSLSWRCDHPYALCVCVLVACPSLSVAVLTRQAGACHQLAVPIAYESCS